MAVLSFSQRRAHADLEVLAERLCWYIGLALMRFTYPRFLWRRSPERFSWDSVDFRTVGRERCSLYGMDGCLLRACSTLRWVVQLVDGPTGAHLWSKTYDRPFSPEATFALQDDLVPRIVSTVADSYGVLPHSMSEAIRVKPLDQLTPYEALL